MMMMTERACSAAAGRKPGRGHWGSQPPPPTLAAGQRLTLLPHCRQWDSGGTVGTVVGTVGTMVRTMETMGPWWWGQWGQCHSGGGSGGDSGDNGGNRGDS
eukprot:6108205-Pyramimonas_sp.AAC.1